MHLKHFSIANYKSYNEVAQLDLAPGINLVVGKNNSGKSALLEAVSTDVQNVPHWSYGARGEVRGEEPAGRASLTFSCRVSDLSNGTPLPLPIPGSPLGQELTFVDVGEDSIRRYMSWVQGQDLALVASFQGKTLADATLLGPRDLGGLSTQNWMDASADRTLGVRPISAQEASQRLKRFAETTRASIKFLPSTRGNTLQPNSLPRGAQLSPGGENVMGVLGELQRNRDRMSRYESLVFQVLPELTRISTRSLQTAQEEAVIWSHAPESEIDDVAPSLARSGTGVRHVLILLLMAFELEKKPSLILVDELEHSLHPGAITKLLDIFATTFSQHQFVIGTHSPTAIAHPRIASISMVTKADGQSHVKTLDRREVRHRRQLLAEVGATASDLFGADAVLWVEGDTEEYCYPRIVEALSQSKTIPSAVIKGVISTGEIDSKRTSERIIQIYEKLSGGDALFPPAVGFVFDREGRTDQEMKELSARSKSRAHFTKSRMFENYLLNPNAIVAVLGAIEGAPAVSRDAVEQWFEANRDGKKYWPQGVQNGGDWRSTIHAADLLKNAFWVLSGERVRYEKTTHSVALCEWLLEHEPEELREIADLITTAMEPSKQAAEA